MAAGPHALIIALLLAVLFAAEGAVIKRDLSKQLESKTCPQISWPDIESGCKNYFLCHDGTTSSFACDEGTLFDATYRACVLANSTSCPSPKSKRGPSHGSLDESEFSCEGRGDNFYADLGKGCKAFYLCKGEQKTPYSCEDGWLFDQDMRACRPPTLYQCPEKEPRSNLILSNTEKRKLDQLMLDLDHLLQEDFLQKA